MALMVLLKYGVHPRTLAITPSMAATRVRGWPATFWKAPAAYTMLPLSPMAYTVLSGFGAQPSGKPVTWSTEARLLRGCPPIELNCPPR
jgi:hypothetical protein